MPTAIVDVFVHGSTCLLNMLSGVLAKYLANKPPGKHTVIDSIIQDMLITITPRQV